MFGMLAAGIGQARPPKLPSERLGPTSGLASWPSGLGVAQTFLHSASSSMSRTASSQPRYVQVRQDFISCRTGLPGLRRDSGRFGGDKSVLLCSLSETWRGGGGGWDASHGGARCPSRAEGGTSWPWPRHGWEASGWHGADFPDLEKSDDPVTACRRGHFCRSQAPTTKGRSRVALGRVLRGRCAPSRHLLRLLKVLAKFTMQVRRLQKCPESYAGFASQLLVPECWGALNGKC